jgi:dienelactone hydrolase
VRRKLGPWWGAALCTCAFVAGDALASEGRDWTVQDSTSVRYFTTNWVHPGFVRGLDDPVQFAPDGAHFFFVTHRADLSTDRTIYEMWVYSTDAVKREIEAGSKSTASGLAPFRRVSMQSDRQSLDGAAAIYLPQWQTNTVVTFVGTEAHGLRRVFRYDIATGIQEPLTEPEYRLGESGGSEYTVRGNTTLFQTYFTQPRPRQAYPFQLVDSELLYELSGRDGPSDMSATHWRLHASYKGAPSRVVAEGALAFMYGAYHSEPSISPDERWAVMIYQPTDWGKPGEWSGYKFPTSAHRFMLLDLKSGLGRPLLESPTGAARVIKSKSFLRMQTAHRGEAFWSSDSRRVLVINAALPLDPGAPEHRDTSYVIDYDVETGKWTVVDVISSAGERLMARPIWEMEGRRLLVVYEKERKPIRERRYSFNGSRWGAATAKKEISPRPTPDLRVQIRQNANEPPRMIASIGHREIALTDEDPALRGVWRAAAESIKFSDSEGREVEAELLQPRDLSADRRPPLVVQFTNVESNLFFPDGLPGTADAAQPLVSRGFAVLKLPAAGGYGAGMHVDASLMQTPKEFPAQVKQVDAAVDALRARKLISDAPIGLVGFSRTGAYVYYVATHPGTTRIGAAVVFDSITNGFGTYLHMAGTLGVDQVKHFSLQFGNGKSFWQNKEGWLDAPDFNLDRLQSPVIFHVTGNPATYYASETLGAFALAERPIEYRYYPGAGHALQSPRQREAAVQSTVDWMTFWLQGQQRDDRAAAEQFTRWQKIKEHWTEVQARESSERKSAPGS